MKSFEDINILMKVKRFFGKKLSYEKNMLKKNCSFKRKKLKKQPFFEKKIIFFGKKIFFIVTSYMIPKSLEA